MLRRIARCAAASTLIATGASAGTIYVRAGATGAADGSSWEDAYPGLAEALSVAAPGDQVWVAAGTYTPGPPGDTASSFALRQDVALYGGFGGAETRLEERRPGVHLTVLSGDVGRDDIYGSPVWWQGWDVNTPNSLHVVTAAGVGPGAVLDGFTITAGRATQAAGGGALILSASPTVRNCTFWRNLAAFGSGGGIAMTDSNPLIDGCTFHQNWVHLGHGAGIYISGASSPTVERCAFTENRVYGDTPEGTGGAISSWSASPVTIDGCAFAGNFAAAFYGSGGASGAYGGAVLNFLGPIAITNSSFVGNSSNAGGALFSFGPAAVTNCLFRNNQAPEYQASQGGWGGVGGAIGASSFTGALLTIRHCTVVQNTARAGAGIRLLNSADADVSGCILWGNTDEFGAIGPAQIRGAGASRSCIQNMLVGIPGEDPPDPRDFPDCFDADPRFADAPAGDLRLADGSPCIDRGDNTAFPAGIAADLDGRPRFADDPATPDLGIPGGAGGAAIIDLGAYERRRECAADLDGSGLLTLNDFVTFRNLYTAGDLAADFDNSGTLTLNDFVAFRNAYVAGCP